MPSSSRSGIAVVIPAKDESQRIGATVRGALGIAGVELVVVVDDGSTDDTAQAARQAGATVVRHSRNQGKAAAMESGASAVAAIESREDRPSPRVLLFLDGDLDSTAAVAAPLAQPVLDGSADMTIAVLPPQSAPGGGRGLVVNLARDGIRDATGWRATQPLSGQRALTREAFEAARPLAAGFGVETGLSIDLLRKGFTVLEVEVPVQHRVTGTDWHAQVHRARQYAHVARALLARGVLPRVRRPHGASPDVSQGVSSDD